MKTIRTKVYSFNELSEQAQQTAIESKRNINVEFEWWEPIYEDASRIGLKLESFDVDRNKHCTGNLFNISASECADLIILEHGEECESYKLAKEFINDWNQLVIKFSDGVNTDKVTYENEQDFDNEADELEKEFIVNLLNYYSDMLQNEMEYLYSDEAVAEAIEANEYEFLASGQPFTL